MAFKGGTGTLKLSSNNQQFKFEVHQEECALYDALQVTDPYSGSDDLEDQGNASEGRSTGEDEGGSGFESSNADEHCDADKVEEEGPFACEEYEAGTDNTVQELGSPGSCTCTEAVADAMFEANEKATTYPVRVCKCWAGTHSQRR